MRKGRGSERRGGGGGDVFSCSFLYAPFALHIDDDDSSSPFLLFLTLPQDYLSTVDIPPNLIFMFTSGAPNLPGSHWSASKYSRNNFK